MSLDECVKLSQLIIKKVQTWPPDQGNNTFITLSGLGAQFSNKIGSTNGRELGSNGSGNRSPVPIVGETSSSTDSNLVTINGQQMPTIISNCSSSTNLLLPTSELVKLNDVDSLSSPSHPQSSPTSTPVPAVVPNGSSTPSSSLSPDTNNNVSLELELIGIVEKLTTQAHFLHENALLFDYTGKQVNGYFSMLRVLQRFFEYVMYQMEKRKRKFQEFYEIACLLSSILSSMQEYRRKYLELRIKFDLINTLPIETNGDMTSVAARLAGDVGVDAKAVKEGDLNESSSGTGTSEVSSNDSEDEVDEEEDGCEFDNISTDMVKLSSDLATSIESMKHLDDECVFTLYDEDFGPELVDPPIKRIAPVDTDSDAKRAVVPTMIVNEPKRLPKTVPKLLQKISDYYSRNEVKKEHNDREYGKEIRKEEYEKNQPKYVARRFNFRLNSLQSPTNEEGSPKKSQPITQKYYKYFDNLTKRFEENFNFTLKSGEASVASPPNGLSSSPANGLPNGKLNGVTATANTANDRVRNDSIVWSDETQQPSLTAHDSEDCEQVETDDEKEQRRVKLDEYILSKFADSNDEDHLITPPMLHFYEGFTLTLNCEKELSLIYGRVGPFWYCKSAAQIVNLVRNLIVILTSPPSKSIASLCNTDYCGRVFAHRQVNATLDSLVHGLASLEVKAYNKRYFKYLYREHVIYGKTVYMPVVSRFTIPNYGNELKRTPSADDVFVTELNDDSIDEESQDSGKPGSFDSTGKEDSNESAQTSQKLDTQKQSNSINARTVRCRLINYSRPSHEPELCAQSDRCLVFHVHGGGFVLSSPDSHELYLRDWAVKLKGIPILSVDYVLRKRYPSAPQDVLDVYLTLVDPRNQQMVIELLGFQPERIILVGDSAGANLILSLLCCLNEIRRTNLDYAHIRMPIAMLAIYGAFDIRAVMSPSKFISSIDPILHHGNIMAMIGTYAGIAQKIRKSLWSRIKNKRSIAWYRVSERELKSRFKHLSSAMESYFASPLIYPRFQDFSQMPMYLVTTHLCPLVDDSVVLYKAWKGPVSFEIFDGLPHAFLNFCDRSEEAKVATDKCIEKIVHAFQSASEI